MKIVRRLDPPQRSVDGLHLDDAVVDEARAAVKDADAVALHLSAHVGDVGLDHLVEARGQRRDLEQSAA